MVSNINRKMQVVGIRE